MSIFDWIAEGNLEKARAAIKESKNVVNSRDELGFTPLMHVAQNVSDLNKCARWVEMLLEAGSRPNDIDYAMGQTALHWACVRKNSSFVAAMQANAPKETWCFYRNFKDQTAADIAKVMDKELWKKLLLPNLPKKDGGPIALAIVGVGAAGAGTFIALVRRLKKSLPREQLAKIKIYLIDRKENLGMGTAYSPELNSATSLLNVAAGGMSIDPDEPKDFVEYISQLEKNGKLGEELGVAAQLGLRPPTVDSIGYYPRLFFGRYAAYRLEQWIQDAQSAGLKIVKMPNSNILKEDPRNKETRLIKLYVEERKGKEASSSNFDVSHVYYTTGHWEQLEPPGAKENKERYQAATGYIPFPMNVKELKTRINFKQDLDVGVIGSSLSAIDAIFSILLQPEIGTLEWKNDQPVYKKNGKHKITCYSRRGLFPRVRPNVNKDADLTYLSPKHLVMFTQWFGGKISLENAVNLLNRELGGYLGKDIDVLVDVDPFKKPNRRLPDEPFNLVERDLRFSVTGDGRTPNEAYVGWYQVMHALFPILRPMYRQFSIEEQRKFDDKYASNFLWAFAPMPDRSAKILLAMNKAGVLDIFPSLNVKSEDQKSILVEFFDHEGQKKMRKHDFLIGTTGLANNFDLDSSILTQNLKKDGLITFSEPGGASKEKGLNMWITDDGSFEVVQGDGESHSPSRRAVGFFLRSQMWDVQAVPTVVQYGRRVAEIYALEFTHRLVGDAMFAHEPKAKL